MLDEAVKRGAKGAALQRVEDEWMARAKLCQFTDAVKGALKKKSDGDWEAKYKEFMRATAASGTSLQKMKKAAQAVGITIFWCWDQPRTREGYYRYQGGTAASAHRAAAYAPYADLLWMETRQPLIEQAREFANFVLSAHPNVMLAYNLSPSFNWDAAGMKDDQIQRFVNDLERLGFVWQFITLAGFHGNAMQVDLFARDFAKRGMLAYVQDIQRKEREQNVETLHHQTWSGAEYVDECLKAVQGGMASTAAMGEGVTEKQFKSKL